MRKYPCEPAVGFVSGKASPALDGSTRVYVIVGDPIAQVKSPGGITGAFHREGLNAVMIPAHVTPEALEGFVRGLSLARNVDGIVATVPHKFAAYAFCSTATARARLLGAVNVLRRNPDGTWHGDMVDGLACVASLKTGGCDLAGKRALLVGSGGAGSAIGHALLEAGVASLAVHDADAGRRDRLLQLLGERTVVGSDDPAGYDVVVNATPAGMRSEDPLPVRVERLEPGCWVADAITAPEVTPLLQAARARGCGTRTGLDMFAAVRDLIVDVLLGRR
jgi:shikimate dehydrogenase